MAKVEIIDSIEEFAKLKTEWNSLLDSSNTDNIFLTWEWQFNWWYSFNNGNRLYIILARDENNRLIGIAPLYFKKKKVINLIPYNELRFIGYGERATSEYLDFICDKRNEESVIEIFLNFLCGDSKSWNVLLLADMAEDTRTKKGIISYINKKKLRSVVKEERFYCPIVKIPSDWGSYLNSMSKSMSCNLRRYLNKIERSFTMEFNAYSNIDAGNGFFEHFQRLYSSRRKEKKEDNKYALKKYNEFQKNIAGSMSDKNWLHLSFLSLNKQIVAAMYSFRYKNKLYAYQMGYDDNYAKFSIGHILISQILKNAIEQKIDEFDFLRGEEWYKTRWANAVRKKVKIIISSAEFSGIIYVCLLKLKGAVFSMSKRVIPPTLYRYLEHKLKYK